MKLLVMGGLYACVVGVIIGLGIWLVRAHKRRTDAQWKIVHRLMSSDRWFLPKELTEGENGNVDPILYRELQRLIANGDVDTIHAGSPQQLHKLSAQGEARVKAEYWR